MGRPDARTLMKHQPNWPKVLYRFPERSGEPFLPSNGTEGMEFTGNWCSSCMHQHPDPSAKPQCDDVLLLSLIGDQPKEWLFSNEGWPVCTKYRHWDWGNEDDGWNLPPAPEPVNPRQLQLPFDLLAFAGYDDFLVLPQAIIERELIMHQY